MSSNDKVIIYTDGLCEPVNPGGTTTWGWSAQQPDGQEIESDYGVVGSGQGMSNNVGEYQGVIEALLHAKGKGWRGVEIRTDSQLVVKQVNREWGCKAAHLIPMRDTAIELLKELKGSIVWVPREENSRADELTRIAYSEVIQEQKSEEKRPLTYKMQGREFEFGPPTSQAELNRLNWLAEKASFRPDWQKEAKRLLDEFEQQQTAEQN